MQIAAHVSFYYNETRRDRLRYLTQVLKHLDAIGTTHDLTVIIYCNQEFSVDSNFPHIRIQTIVVKFFDRFFPRRLRRYLPHSVRRLVDPKYLTWAHREYVLNTIDKYDVHIYLDDDTAFTDKSLEYWLNYKGLCIENNYNLGFLRIERDEQANKWHCTDVLEPPSRLVRLGDRLFAHTLHFYGFWIYDKAELKRFAQSERWHPRQSEYGEYIIERAELGWHADYLPMYRGTLIPVKNIENSLYVVDEECGVHHMPNNYIGHWMFCKFEFPLQMVLEEKELQATHQGLAT